MKRNRRYANNRHCEKAQPTKQSSAIARVTGLPRLPYGLFAITVFLFTIHLSLFTPSPAFAACASPAGDPGQIVYNDDFRMMQYCNGNDEWIKMGPQPYLRDAVSFAGSDWLSRGGDLTGIADTKQATGAGWFRRVSTGVSQVIYTNTGSRMKFRFNSSDYFVVEAKNAALTDILIMGTQNTITDTDWHHFMFSFDLADTGKRHLYIDGVANLQVGTYTNDVIDFTTTNHAIGADTGGSANHWEGDLADIWLDIGRYINLSLEKNRRLFLDANGMPVDLGADGSNPTGSAPDIYLTGDTPNWHVNAGTGGGFIENGTLTDAATSPGDTRVLGSGTWAQVGNSFALVHQDGTVTALSTNLIAVITESGDQLVTYRWDGTNWSQVGNSLALSATDPALATLNSTTIAFIDESGNQLRTYQWSGNDWSLVGAGFTFTGGTVANPSIESLDEKTIAFVDDTFDQLRTYSWNGSAWSQTGASLALTTVNDSSIARLNSKTIALVNGSGDTIRTYTWNGSTWALVGNPANLVSIADTTLARLDDETVVFLDETIKQLRTYAWNGSDWLQKGGILSFSSASSPELVALDSRTIAYLDDFYDTLRTYQNTVGCISPNGQAGMMVYNRSSNTMQFCNGSAWVDMNPIAEPVDSLAGHWKLDEITFTSAADSSGNGNTGSLQGGLNPANDTVSGVRNGAIKFDGTDDYIDMGTTSSLKPALPLSVAAWIYIDPSASGVNFPIFRSDYGSSNYSGYWLNISSGGKAEISFGNDGGSGSTARRSKTGATTLEVGKWYHVVGVMRGETDMDLYIDSIDDGGTYSGTGGPIDYNGTAPTYIGRNNYGFNAYAKGLIDDVRVYGKALTAAEVVDLYNKAGGNPVGDPMNGLVGYWPMNDAAGSATAADLAGDGTANASGGVIFNPAGGRIGGAASFDGVDDILKPSLNPALNDIATLTFTAWIYPTDWGGGTFGRIGSKENAASTGGIEIYVGSDTAQRLQVRSNRPTDGLWVSPNSSIVLNTWQHVAVVYDNTSVANDPLIYINGTPATVTETATPIGAPTTDSTLNWRIGNSNVLSRGFDGLIDDVRIYNRLLSAKEIDAIYDAGAAGKAALDCTGPDGIEGEMLYNTTNNVMQFCNGNSWIGISGHGDILAPAGGMIGITASRVQYKMSTETDPSSVTLDAVPTAGNLLVAIAAHRREAGGPTISDAGPNDANWTQHIAFSDHTFAETGSTSYRRGLAVWSKIADGSETSVTVDFGDGASRLLVQEFSISGGTPSFDVSNFNVGPEQTLITSLTTNATATSTTANSLVVTALMSRDSLGGGVSWTNGVANDIGTNSTISLHSGYKLDTTAGTKESTASWTSSINAATGIVVFKIE